MCGIIGALSNSNVVPQLLQGLRRLEYRGYDSAGLSLVSDAGIHSTKSVGDVAALERRIAEHPVSGCVGISHTRWATHGAPSTLNAHPHGTERVSIVHNGIVENYRELRVQLHDAGKRAKGETDTEILSLMIDWGIEQQMTPTEAMRWALARVEGTYAVAAVFASQPDTIIAARDGSPLCIGMEGDDRYLASDALALPEGRGTYVALEDGDICVLSPGCVEITDRAGKAVERRVQHLEEQEEEVGKGQHKHFMHKEIFEQTKTISASVASAGDLEQALDALEGVETLTILACGTSYHAGLVAAHWLEEFAGVAVQVELASEFRYRKRVARRDHAVLAISQSGETADTLAALQCCQEQGLASLAIVNVGHSSMAKLVDVPILTAAGPEIGVASTKAFTAQLAAAFALSLALGRRRNLIADSLAQFLEHHLQTIERDVEVVLEMEPQLSGIARRIAAAKSLFIIGRGNMHAMALEGALKVKETSYIHAEGFAGGELKHGSIALIEPGTPVLALCPRGEVAGKTRSNAAEVACRGAEVIFLESVAGEPEQCPGYVRLPHVPECMAPFIYAPALQLISYHVAVERNTNVDRPRNLAKSVTVE